MGEVLTLAEATAYLRVPEEEVLRMVREQGLHGRQFASEWRFPKAAIQDWLRTEPSQPRSSKEALLALAGKYKSDPDLEFIVEKAMLRRGRPAAKGAGKS